MLMSNLMAQFSIGPRVGLNLASVVFSGDEIPEETSFQYGFVVGVSSEIKLSNRITIQPELLFSGAGFTFKDDYFGDNVITYNYLQIPTLAKMKFVAGPVGLNIVAGPHFGYGIGKIKSEVTSGGETEKQSMSWQDTYLKRFDFGMTGGFGMSISAGSGTFGLDARYQLGLVNYFDEAEGDLSIKNRTFQFGLSYLFPIGG